MLEIYQLERQYDTAIKTVTVGDIIKNTDLENKEEIISRFGNLTFQDAMTKTETIRGLIQTATSYGASEELLNSAIAEIIAGQNETPAVDQLMSVLEDAFKQEMQKNDQNLSNAVDLLMSSPSQQAQVESMANELAPSPEMLGLTTEQPQE